MGGCPILAETVGFFSKLLVLHYGDLTDSTNVIRIIQQVQPDETYNFGAQSHVAVSYCFAEAWRL